MHQTNMAKIRIIFDKHTPFSTKISFNIIERAPNQRLTKKNEAEATPDKNVSRSKYCELYLVQINFINFIVNNTKIYYF